MASAEPAETPQPSVCGRATKRVTLFRAKSASPSFRRLAMRRAIWPEHRLVGITSPTWSETGPRPVLIASNENSTSGAAPFTGRGSPSGSGAFASSSRFSGPVCFQSRQIETWAWPARSPTVFSPEAARGGDHFYGGAEGEVRDRAVACGEEDHVGARRHLPGDALQAVAGAIHKVETTLAHRLRVLDDAVYPHLGVLLPRGPDGFYGDVVEAAEVVPA